MASFTVTLEIAAPASLVWAALVDWPGHAEWAPLTTVRVTSPRPDGVGASFVARSGIGPLGFDDAMTVVGWQPPAGDEPGDRAGRCEIDKHGRVVRGIAWFEVVPLTGRRSRLIWYEDVTVMPNSVTRHFAGVVSAVGRVGFRRSLRTMARDVERHYVTLEQPPTATP